MFPLVDRLQARYEKAKAHLAKLTQSVLAKAFSGEFVRTEAELAGREGREYETAEELLKRIKEQQATTKTERGRKTTGGMRGTHRDAHEQSPTVRNR